MQLCNYFKITLPTKNQAIKLLILEVLKTYVYSVSYTRYIPGTEVAIFTNGRIFVLKNPVICTFQRGGRFLYLEFIYCIRTVTVIRVCARNIPVLLDQNSFSGCNMLLIQKCSPAVATRLQLTIGQQYCSFCHSTSRAVTHKQSSDSFSSIYRHIPVWLSSFKRRLLQQ